MNRKVKPFYSKSITSTSFQTQNSSLKSLSYELCQPMIVLGQMMGLLSWDLTLHSLDQPKPNFWKRTVAMLYKLAAALVVLYVIVIQVIMYMETKMTTPISALAYKANKLSQMSFVFFILTSCLWDEQRFHQLLKNLRNADNLLERTVQKQRFMMRYTFLQCAFTLELLVSWVTISALGTATISAVTIYSLNLFLVLAYDLFVLAFFIKAAHLCSQSFSALNSKLSEVLAQKSEGLYDYLNQLRFHYEQLYQLAGSVEVTFGCIIAADLALQTVAMCLISYMVLNITLELRDVPFLLELLISAYRIYVIAAAADSIAVEARLGLQSLHNVHDKELTRQEEFQVMILVNKLSQHPIEINPAGGLFTLNKRTFTTILGTMFTYLIVLMQFLPSSIPGNTQPNATATNGTD